MLLAPIPGLTPGCISDLTFDRWRGGELDEAHCRELSRHLGDCASCDARRAALDAAAQSFFARPEYARELPRLRTELRRRRQRSRFALSALATAAVALLVWWPSDAPTSSSDRRKGPGSIGFYVKRGDEVFRGRAGQRVRPHDQLQFTWRGDRPAYLAILSLDAARSVSTYYPPPNVQERLVPTGAEIALTNAVELDDLLGPERVFVVSCDDAPPVDLLRQQLVATRHLGAPPGCQLQQLELYKEPAP